jgi:hypothetical protein
MKPNNSCNYNDEKNQLESRNGFSEPENPDYREKSSPQTCPRSMHNAHIYPFKSKGKGKETDCINAKINIDGTIFEKPSVASCMLFRRPQTVLQATTGNNNSLIYYFIFIIYHFGALFIFS